ncbi:MAG: carbonate dehydratase [Bacillaceae bacterium]|nr:carbonate dehydratase [Bacillaceae bacterium]
MSQDQLRQGNKRFVEKMKEEQPGLFDQLKEGQSPDVFLLSCCDSRVSPSVVTGASLGEIFVHRNIANQVAEDDDSFNASLYYALHHLKVKKVVIMGHTFCGGIQAAWEGNQEEELKPWIERIRKNLPDRAVQPCISVNEVSRKNVIKQVNNLKNHPIYQKYGHDVNIEGYLFHLETGELEKVTD